MCMFKGQGMYTGQRACLRVRVCTLGNVHVSMLLSQCTPPSPPHTAPTHLFLCLRLHCCPVNRFIFLFLFSSSDFYRAGGIMLSNFKLYHKATVSKAVWLRHIEQWNSRESSEINRHIYHQLTYNKKDKNIQWKTASSISGDLKTGQLHVKK